MTEREYASRDAMLATRLPEDDMEIPGLGWFRVRGLSRLETLKMQALPAQHDRDAFIFACGLVQPAFTEAQARTLQASSPGAELEPLTERIAQLSGLVEGAEKAAFKEFEADPGSEFRPLPSGEAEPDGGGATGTDQQ